MSDLRVTNLRGRTAGSAPTLPDGIVITGIATATTFSGNATGLSGTPNITVGIATATSFVGALTGNATGLSGNPIISVSGVNNSGVATLTDLRLSSIADKTTIVSGNSVSLSYSTGGGNVAICTNPSGPITLNVTGIPTDSSFDNHSISFGVMVNQTGTARSCTAVTLNGYSATIRFAGGSLSAAISGVTTTSGMDIYNFTGINTVGSASTTANYYLLGVVNGGFR